MKSSFEFLLSFTFRVMNNLKNLCNSTVIQSVNENESFGVFFIADVTFD